MLFRFKDGSFDFKQRGIVIFGILNVTTDSFSDGGKFIDPSSALDHALKLIEDGADVIDVGGESTRPGADEVLEEEETRRILAVLKPLREQTKTVISIDTTKAAVARAAIAEGAAIINDVSGLRADPKMAEVVASARAGLVLMHSRGTPRNMKTLCDYTDLMDEVERELGAQLDLAEQSGIPRQNIAIDPGIGFAKTADQSHQILKELTRFTMSSGRLSKYPLLIGVSRKSFMGGRVDSRGEQTILHELDAIAKGALMVRTHDVGKLRKAWLEVAG
jgi:dihydropteroate synthase